MKPAKLAAIFFLLILFALPAQAAVIIDDAGQKFDFDKPPVRVVSILPAASEIICVIGAGKTLAGVTYNDGHFAELAQATVIGGAFTPQFKIINSLKPDLLIVAPRDFEKAKKGRGDLNYDIFVWNDGVSLAGSETRIKWLGEIFQKQTEAQKIIDGNREMFRTLKAKTDKINPKKRVIRLLQSGGELLTPGEDSFQSELIVAAGGLPPKFGQGSFLPVALEEWKNFNPEIIYACGSGRDELMQLLDRPGWNEVAAVKDKQVYYFPCSLTCRAAAHTGYFSAWLSSNIYADEFAETDKLVWPQEVLSERPIELNLPYVAKARIVDSRMMDFVHRTLLIDFKNPQTAVSTAGGAREGLEVIGNSFSPTPVWSVYHKLGFERSREDLFKVLGLNPEKTEMLTTGADLNNLAVKTAAYKDITVTALATAGVESNALRSSKDAGGYYEPGTINIIVLTNCRLSPRASTRAIITITEAKTAALWDMDIRSAQSALFNPATGTGTDDIIVVSGEGPQITSTGGHTKMGELIAQTVYEAVQEALLKQNGKARTRNIFERLAERGISPAALTGGPDCPCQDDVKSFQVEFESLLLEPRYQGFLEAAFSLSDAENMGQLNDLSAFDAWAKEVAGEIAGKPVGKIENVISRENLPPVLKTALNALGTGLKQRLAAASD